MQQIDTKNSPVRWSGVELRFRVKKEEEEDEEGGENAISAPSGSVCKRPFLCVSIGYL